MWYHSVYHYCIHNNYGWENKRDKMKLRKQEKGVGVGVKLGYCRWVSSYRKVFEKEIHTSADILVLHYLCTKEFYVCDNVAAVGTVADHERCVEGCSRNLLSAN